MKQKGNTKAQRVRRHARLRVERRGHLLVKSARDRARDKAVPCDLDRDDIQRRIDAGSCELTGLPFDLNAPPMAWNTPSLDRIRPGEGYTKNNVRVVLFAVNAMLNTWGPERIIQVADALKARALTVPFVA